MNAVIVGVMKAKRKTSFEINDKPLGHESRRIAAITRLAQRLDAAGVVRRPIREEIADLAVALAREERDIGPQLEELFYWPASATPCRDHRRLFLPVVEQYKNKAEEQLRRHYAYYHALGLRRQRWCRAHPRPRGMAWTRPSPRRPPPSSSSRRPSPLPDRITRPDAPAPPRDIPSIRHPRRESDRILCYTQLFDNRIATTDANQESSGGGVWNGSGIRIGLFE